MTRKTRFFAALLAMASMLLAQWAVASYACDEIASTVSTLTASHDGGAPMDEDALCREHCQQAKYMADPAAHPVTAAIAAPAAMRVASVEEIASRRIELAFHLPEPTPPPPRQRFTVLRF